MQMYPYAVGRIRAIEKNLLSPQKYELLRTAKTDEEAMKILTDSGYEPSYDIDSMLTAEFSKTCKLLSELVPDSDIFDVFLYKNDFHNLKVFLKEELCGIDSSGMVYPFGSVDSEKLKNAFTNRELEGISPFMATAIKNASDIYAKTSDFRLADTEIDKCTFLQMHDTANKCKNKFVSDIITAMTDIANIRSLLRVLRVGGDVSFLLSVICPGGSLDTSVFLNALSKHESGAISHSPYADMYTAGINEGYDAFEVLADKFMQDKTQDAKYMSLSIEPLVAYFLAKEREFKQIRIIMTGRQINE